MDSNVENLIYLPDADYTDLMRKIESALGFKLFVWQWLYVGDNIYFYGRRTGRTTAACLWVLLADIERKPIILPHKSLKRDDEFIRRQLLDMKQKLDDAGIETNEIHIGSKVY